MYLNNAWRSLNHYAKCCVYSRIQWGRDDAVVDLGGYLGTLKINHIALSNYTTRTLFHFIISKKFLTGCGHLLPHHFHSLPHNGSYIRMVAFLKNTIGAKSIFEGKNFSSNWYNSPFKPFTHPCKIWFREGLPARLIT